MQAALTSWYISPIRDLVKTNLICTHCACSLGELSEASCDVLGSSPKGLRASFEHRLPVLWDVRLEGSCRTNPKPTESRWRRIFAGPVWIPGGFCSNTSLLCPPCPAGSLAPQPGNSPSYPPAPHSWKPAAGRACWSDLSHSRSPGRGWCQLSPPPVGHKKIIWNLKNTTWKKSQQLCYPLCVQPAWCFLALTFLGCCWDFSQHLLLYRKFLLGVRRDKSLSQAPSFLRRSTTLCKVLATSSVHTSQFR